MISELVDEMKRVLKTMPPEHPRHQILNLLAEATRFDANSVERRPTTLFQCLWNSCWWYDCLELTEHSSYSFVGDIYAKLSRLRYRMLGWLTVEPATPKLHTLLESWRLQKEQRTPGFRWLRSLRPPAVSLDGRTNTSLVSGWSIKLLDVSPDGTRVVAASNEHWIGVWSGDSGIMLATLFLHIRGVTDVKFAPDGTWFGGLSYYGREMIAWETASLKEIRKPEAELSQLLFDHSRRPSRYAVQSDDAGAMILSDTNVELACLPERANWSSDLSGRLWATGSFGDPEIYRLEGALGEIRQE